MIVFELICDEAHRFEGWFGSSEDYERQEDASLLTCPVCGSSGVRRLPSAKVRKSARRPASDSAEAAEKPRELPAEAKEMALASFLEHVLANTEDVGRRFPEEARKIHYEEVPRRAIRGIATRAETLELLDEGVPVVPLPIPTRGEMH